MTPVPLMLLAGAALFLLVQDASAKPSGEIVLRKSAPTRTERAEAGSIWQITLETNLPLAEREEMEASLRYQIENVAGNRIVAGPTWVGNRASLLVKYGSTMNISVGVRLTIGPYYFDLVDATRMEAA